MKLRLALALAMTAAACHPAPAPVALPAILVQHDEPPYGDAVNHRRVVAMLASLDRLEPAWGKLDVSDYAVAPGNDGKLWGAIGAGIPPGWQPVALDGSAPRYGTLRAWHTGKHLFAVLRVDPGIASDIPVLILRDRSVEQAGRASG
ncbi:hypothetical protein PX554_17760 [Sphingomonas sp. H39-1-10]|uniref:hypothetical protein n=1 Tax=Sphingomonas TaxID=13687 RepID=UPI00088B62BF|nr:MULTISPECIES: hypothetical protein [Sphingomonas]MDF0489984.1 hypothetical protein [Sphingomonas pollutisoli]SDA36196.1 hypothetical protein SAMN03159340_03563 [Sphingomonas sp. NFR15]